MFIGFSRPRKKNCFDLNSLRIGRSRIINKIQSHRPHGIDQLRGFSQNFASQKYSGSSNHKLIKILPYGQKEIYSTIIDVNLYPEFVPYCKSTKILERRISRPNLNYEKIGEGESLDKFTRLDGNLYGNNDERFTDIFHEMDVITKVGYKGFETDYFSRVICEPFKSVQVIARPSSTFSKLLTTWSLTPSNESTTISTQSSSSSSSSSLVNPVATKVTLDLSFKFKNPLHSLFLTDEMIWRKFSQKMIDAFEKRIYERHLSKK